MSQPPRPIRDDEAVAVVVGLMEAEQVGYRLPPIQLGPYTAFTLISALQMATRHPDMSETFKDGVLRILGDQLSTALVGMAESLEHRYLLHALIDAGWDPAYDAPSGQPS